jgi:sigma-B regulation protein RsbU (phosphoserine phosphatase)
MGILIIEDDDDTRKIMERLIIDDGHRGVVTAESAEKAFSLLGGLETQFDLIFLDVNMPEIDGIQSCGRIREDPRYRSVPIVMTTARADMATIDRAFKSGATDYLTKPLKPADLLACVRAKLKLKAELDMRDLLESELAGRFQQLGTLAGGRY